MVARAGHRGIWVGTRLRRRAGRSIVFLETACTMRTSDSTKHNVVVCPALIPRTQQKSTARSGARTRKTLRSRPFSSFKNLRSRSFSSSCSTCPESPRRLRADSPSRPIHHRRIRPPASGDPAFLSTRPNISESHSEISTRVPHCITGAVAGRSFEYPPEHQRVP